MAEADSQALIDGELGLARGCAAVLTVSEAERQLFAARRRPTERSFVVGHAVEPRPTPNAFERRRSILFVGAFSAAFSERRRRPASSAAMCAGAASRAGLRAPIVVAGADIPGPSDGVRRSGGLVAFRRRRPDAALRRGARVRGADAVLGGDFAESHRGRGARRPDRLHAARRGSAGLGVTASSC